MVSDIPVYTDASIRTGGVERIAELQRTGAWTVVQLLHHLSSLGLSGAIKGSHQSHRFPQG